MDRTLVDVAYIVKYPQPGRVKTRLAASIGDQSAAQWYRAAAAKTFAVLKSFSEFRVTVSFDPPETLEPVKQWLPGAPNYLAQCTGGLGDRLRHVATTLWTENHRPLLLIGGDCPGIDEEYLQQAIDVLRNNRHVIGPATDGGYVLLGLWKPVPTVFSNISWSTNQVLSQTKERIRSHSDSLTLLPPLSDVDTEQDMRKYEP